MFNNPKFADMEIIVGDIDVPVHRFVLCLQSEYFSNALDGAFAEGSTNTLICLPGKEHAYLRVLRYLYTGDYEDEPSSLITNGGRMYPSNRVRGLTNASEQMIMSCSKILGSTFWRMNSC